MFITQIVQGEVTELYLCEECAKKRGLIDPVALSFNEKFFPENFQQQIENLLKKVELDVNKLTQQHIEDDDDVPSMTCPICQFSLSNYRKTGRVGCPDCYDSFAAYLGTELTQQENQDCLELDIQPKVRIKQLEQQMAKAVEIEDYEAAASLRDQIKQLQQEG